MVVIEGRGIKKVRGGGEMLLSIRSCSRTGIRNGSHTGIRDGSRMAFGAPLEGRSAWLILHLLYATFDR